MTQVRKQNIYEKCSNKVGDRLRRAHEVAVTEDDIWCCFSSDWPFSEKAKDFTFLEEFRKERMFFIIVFIVAWLEGMENLSKLTISYFYKDDLQASPAQVNGRDAGRSLNENPLLLLISFADTEAVRE